MAKRPYLPLRGVRVLSFEVAFSLPAGTRTLAELGADVVRVSPPARGFGTYISVVDGVFMNKPNIGIDLKSPGGVEVARRLVACAEVVTSNFTPHVMSGFGLGPDDLRSIKPDLIVLQLSGYGVPGPWQEFPAYGPSVEAAGGMNRLMGAEGDPPVRVGSGVFADQLSGRYAALALMAALRRRKQTGAGQYIDVSMYECISHILGQNMVAAARQGRRMPARLGNRDAEMAPHGVYPSAGKDEWVALSVRDDSDWRALRNVIADERLMRQDFETVEGRRAGRDQIDAAIAAWTGPLGKADAAARLQAAGVPAGPVQAVGDIPFDRHLIERGALQMVQHDSPILGYEAHPHLTTPWVAQGRERTRLRDIRFAGADNAAVLKSWLGMKKAQVQGLEKAGALFVLQPGPIADRPPAAGAARANDFAQRLGLRPAAEGAGTEAAK